MKNCFFYFIALLVIILFPGPISAQAVGNVTGVQVSGNTLQLQCGTDMVIFRVCTENVIMINLRPDGIESPDTLIVSNTSWAVVPATIDTNSDPITIQTSNFRIEIARNPMRIYGYNSSGVLLFNEPAAMGINPAGISLTTTGGNFYGIHSPNPAGLLAASGNIYSGSQGQAGGPFVWTTKGWGMFADIDSGRINLSSNSITFLRTTNPMKVDIEFYFIFGSPKDIMNGMTDVTGKPPLFPKYSFGFLNSQWGMNQNKLLGYVSTYRSKGIPLDAYILDFDWMDWGADYYGEFRFGPNFPSSTAGVLRDTLLKNGVKLFGIRKPRVHTFTIEGQYALSRHYFVDSLIDYFSHKEVGRMNFNIPGARQWFYSKPSHF
jgi:alpha-glucosidase